MDENAATVAEMIPQLLTMLKRPEGLEQGCIDLCSYRGLFTNEMAQQLGLALLDTNQDVTELNLPIAALTSAGRPFPALLEYLENTRTLGDVLFKGGKVKPIPADETLDLLIGSVKKQHATKSIFIQTIQLSKSTIQSLQAFEAVIFFGCSIQDPDNVCVIKRSSSTAHQLRATKKDYLFFGYEESPQFLRAVADVFCSRDAIAVRFDPTSPHHEQKLAAALYLAKQHKNLQYLQLNDIDTDGSRAPELLAELSSIAVNEHFTVALKWSTAITIDRTSFQKNGKVILKALSNTLLVDFKYQLQEGGDSLFSPAERRAADIILSRNRKVPQLLQRSEEYWMANLAVLQRMLHPKFLCHPRYRRHLTRFLRNNFTVHMWLQERYIRANKQAKHHSIAR